MDWNRQGDLEKTTPVWKVVVKDGRSVCGRLEVAAESASIAEEFAQAWAKRNRSIWTARASASRKMAGGVQLHVWVA